MKLLANVGSNRHEGEVKHNMACLWHEVLWVDIAKTSRVHLGGLSMKTEVAVLSHSGLSTVRAKIRIGQYLQFLLNAVSNVDAFNIECITLKYFECGHTFIMADSAHAEIEEQMGIKRKVFDYS